MIKLIQAPLIDVVGTLELERVNERSQQSKWVLLSQGHMLGRVEMTGNPRCDEGIDKLGTNRAYSSYSTLTRLTIQQSIDKVPRTQTLILPMTAISSIQITVIRHAPIPHTGPHHKKSLSRRLNLHTADTKQQPRPIPTYSTSHIQAEYRKDKPSAPFLHRTLRYNTMSESPTPPHPNPDATLTIHPSSLCAAHNTHSFCSLALHENHKHLA